MIETNQEKILILRFSSFGDITQALSVPAVLKKAFPQSEIHWATRADFAHLIEHHPDVDRLWTLKKGSGLGAVFGLARQLQKEGYTRVYDAHNSLRSRVISFLLWPKKIVRKKSFRFKRFLLFKFRVNTFPKPFSGQRELLRPLARWGISETLPPPPQLFLDEKNLSEADQLLAQHDLLEKEFIALAASAAHALKRWPTEHWKDLITRAPGEIFILLGGPEDDFYSDIVAAAPERTYNFAGKLSLAASAAVVKRAKLLISNDTGLMHVAEQFGKPCVALMGPAPFGFPTRETTTIMELNLPCQPCSKHGQGPCVNPEFQKCLRDIAPMAVLQAVHKQTERGKFV